MKLEYNQEPLQVIKGQNKDIAIFPIDGENIDPVVVEGFGNEWIKFKDYSEKEIESLAIMYFDILNDTIINKNTYALDIGCGTGRWTKYLSKRIGFIEAIDPSSAVVAADHLLAGIDNVRIAKASVETIPFDDETFDFAMSIGVLHHIPNTQKAMIDCVKKVKKGGYFYCYLYHNLETRGWLFKTFYRLSDLIRKVVCRLPTGIKKIVCDILAVVIYMPLVLLGRFFISIGLRKIATKIPLSAYTNKSFFIIRNDSLDKFGTTLEQRFSKKEVEDMMRNSGLDNIVISPLTPFYHVVGKKV